MSNKIKIKNEPKTNYLYEFQVVVKTNIPNVFEHVDYFTNGFLAEQTAIMIQDAIILHNVKVQGRKLKEN